jgi:hypothetical protein
MKLSTHTKVISLLALLPIFFTFLSGCSNSSASSQDGLKMASMEGMPKEVTTSPTVVRQAYQFAAANPDVLKYVPCYCGCDDIGHTSNYACYISGVKANGDITYDSHALGCSVCVDITQDVMRLSRQNKPVGEI